MSAYFITASGTNVGKTFATCALIHAARAAGISVHAVKPIISGFDANNPTGSDTAEIAAALGATSLRATEGSVAIQHAKHSKKLDRHGDEAPRDDEKLWNSISPWQFRAPLSPNMAAAAEGKSIDFDEVVKWSRGQLNHAQLNLVEGVGGVMVPLSATHTVRDWMAALNIPAIIVTGSYLGAISHALTAIEALRAANIPIQAMIVSESESSTVPLQETYDTLCAFTRDIPLRIMQPLVLSPRHATAIHDLLEKLM